MKKWRIILLFMTLMIFFVGCSSSPPATVSEGGKLEVHYIDVGQADAILIKTPNQGNIMIDGGGNSTQQALVDYLKKEKVTKLDYVIGTHPHEDHIGGLDYVIEQFEVGAVFMPKVSHTTKTYENVLLAVQDKGLKVKSITSGLDLPLAQGDVSATFLAPNGETYGDLNNYSGVLRLVYGGTSFMFTGDAETLSEDEILQRYSSKELQSTVLKMGHHGSTTSSSEAFLKAVKPQLAIISCGKDNDYGHPHQEILDRLEDLQIPYKRTDLQGSIVVTSDGQTVGLSDGTIKANPVEESTAQAVAPMPAPAQEPAPTPEPNNTAGGTVAIASVDRAAEVVVLQNNGSAAVDLSNWVLVSVQGDQRFTIPNGTTLGAGETLSVVSGAGAKAGEGQLLWNNQNIWNNKSDPAELYDQAGGLISSME